MDRKINLSPYKEVSMTRETLHHTFIEEVTIIILDVDDCYYIKDDIEKIKDISQMPSYIKEDWIKYNKKELTKKILDDHIEEYSERYEWQNPKDDSTYESLITLKSIKRDFLIKKIID